MNERSIRERLRRAVGESAAYPPGLANRIRVRLGEPAQHRERSPFLVALTAAILALAIVATFMFIGQSQGRRTVPNGPVPTPTSTSTAYKVLCRLPMDRGTGAFLDVPANPPQQNGMVDKSAEDPASNITRPNGEPRIALSYDWPLNRWLPVPYQWVSADGARYVYPDSQARVHLVGVSDGSDQVIASGALWGIYGFGSDGLIYAGQRDPSKQPSLTGLWRIPTSGGAPQQLASQGTWLAIGTDAAWSMVSNGPPPSGYSIPEGSLGTVLQRLDLKSGAIATWYTSNTGGRYRVAAVDAAGRPVLVGVATAPQLLIVTGAGAAQPITSSTVFDLMADSHGIWYEDTMGVSVYLVEGSAGRWMGQYGFGGNFKFAGPCK
jgi:hypothetical protein